MHQSTSGSQLRKVRVNLLLFMNSLPRRASLALLACVFAFTLYRAKTQSFTVDEAFVFLRFVDVPWADFFGSYDAANHVLHTLLMRVSRAALGSSELVLRLPSLLGCVLYLWAVERLTSRTFGPTWLQPFSVAALTLNPLVLDYLCAARGYGLALALCMWAMLFLTRYLTTDPYPKQLRRAGIFAGLSIAANLTFIVPITALGMVTLIASAAKGWRRIWLVGERFGGPAIVVAFLFVILPLAKASGSNFYIGVPTLEESAAILWYTSILHTPERSLGQFLEPAAVRNTVLVTALVVTVGAGLWSLGKLWRGNVSTPVALLALSGGVTGTAVLLVVALHRWAGVPYPYERTGLYFIPMLTSALLIVFSLVPVAAVRAVGFAAVAVMLLVYVSQLEPRYFAEWRFDARTRELMRAVRNDAAAAGLVTPHFDPDVPLFTVGSSMWLEPAANYYRRRLRLFSMRPVERGALHARRFRYYLLLPEDFGLVEKLNLSVLLRDNFAGVLLAKGE